MHWIFPKSTRITNKCFTPAPIIIDAFLAGRIALKKKVAQKDQSDP